MNELTRYAQANAELQAAKKAVAEIARSLKDFTDNLARRPETMCFVNLDGEDQPGLAERLGLGCAHWTAADFPTPSAIQRALERRFAAAATAVLAWDAVPDDLRESMIPPRP